MPTKRLNQLGMTLVEILVGLVMVSIIATGVYNLFRAHNIMAARQEETTRMQQELLAALVDMSEEIRMCGFRPLGIGNFGFNASATNQTSIYCTRGISTNNNSTDIISYRRNSNNELEIYISNNNTWEPIAFNISNLNFSYYDSDGVEILPVSAGNADEIRMIEIKATAIPSDARKNLNISARDLHTRVWLRNMGLE